MINTKATTTCGEDIICEGKGGGSVALGVRGTAVPLQPEAPFPAPCQGGAVVQAAVLPQQDEEGGGLRAGLIVHQAAPVR